MQQFKVQVDIQTYEKDNTAIKSVDKHPSLLTAAREKLASYYQYDVGKTVLLFKVTQYDVNTCVITPKNS